MKKEVEALILELLLASVVVLVQVVNNFSRDDDGRCRQTFSRCLVTGTTEGVVPHLDHHRRYYHDPVSGLDSDFDYYYFHDDVVLKFSQNFDDYYYLIAVVAMK